MKSIVLLRHGESIWNKRETGSPDWTDVEFDRKKAWPKLIGPATY